MTTRIALQRWHCRQERYDSSLATSDLSSRESARLPCMGTPRPFILSANKLRRSAPHSPLACSHGAFCDWLSVLAVWRRLQLSDHVEATGSKALLIAVSGSALSRLRGGAGWRACAFGHVI